MESPSPMKSEQAWNGLYPVENVDVLTAMQTK